MTPVAPVMKILIAVERWSGGTVERQPHCSRVVSSCSERRAALPFHRSARRASADASVPPFYRLPAAASPPSPPPPPLSRRPPAAPAPPAGRALWSPRRLVLPSAQRRHPASPSPR